ncbi:hypothetical protein ACVWZL_001312 [Bradyrhizobium sp. GM2.4]
MTKSKTSLWEFVKSDANRRIVSWIGGGLVVVMGGLFTFYTYVDGGGRKSGAQPSITAGPGGIAVNGPVTQSPLTTNVTK